MKFRVLCAIALCICLGQLCKSNTMIEEGIKKIKDDLQYKIHGVGEQFVEDITTILDHTPSIPYFLEFLRNGLVHTLGHITLKQNNVKFSVSDMSFVHYVNSTQPDYHESLRRLDIYRILQSILSKDFPAERYNGIVNMFYIDGYPNATSEEIANVVNYLEGTDNAARVVSYLDLHNFPDPVASDCPFETEKYSEAVDHLKSMIDIKPKVFEDFASIHEKFPCHGLVNSYLKGWVGEIVELHDSKSKINACAILEGKSRMDLRNSDEFQYHSTMIESILSLRLPDETFRGQFNFIKANVLNAPQDEIEKALGYLYEDVPKADCSSRSKVQNGI